MRPPHAAAKLALEKKTLMKKHWEVVARQNTSRKTKITEGSLYWRIFPYCAERHKWKMGETEMWTSTLTYCEKHWKFLWAWQKKLIEIETSREIQKKNDCYSWLIKHRWQSKMSLIWLKYLIYLHFPNALIFNYIIWKSLNIICHSFTLPVWRRTLV